MVFDKSKLIVIKMTKMTSKTSKLLLMRHELRQRCQ